MYDQVFVDPLTPGDLLYIAANKFPSLAAPNSSAPDEVSSGSPSLLSRMIAFNRQVAGIVWVRGVKGAHVGLVSSISNGNSAVYESIEARLQPAQISRFA